MMHKLLNKLISKGKGNNYSIDQDIPSSYLIGMVWGRILMILRGKIIGIKNGGLLFIGANVRIKCKSKLSLGKCVTLAAHCYIDALSKNGIQLGNNVSVGKFTRIEATGNMQYLGLGMQVGNNVGLGTDCFYGCAGGIEIGDDTIIGNLVTFHAENHIATDRETPIRSQGVVRKGIIIKNNCWIGAKATILDGVILEQGCIVAAGAVLKEGTYEAYGIYGGVPAKLLRFRNDKS